MPTDINKNIIIQSDAIRYQFDSKLGKYYFSIVDVISITTDSSDARNYWKVLKNRLKKSNLELVTSCNQLKLLAQDGKYYLTDTADSDTLLGIIQHVSPTHVRTFRQWFEKIESVKSREGSPQENDIKKDIHSEEEAELAIDAYETKTHIVILSMVAGVNPSDLFITVDYKSITIKGKRFLNSENSRDNYRNDEIKNEIYCGGFARTIMLPSFIEVDEVEAILEHGLLTIKMQKIDTNRTRIIKLK